MPIQNALGTNENYASLENLFCLREQTMRAIEASVEITTDIPKMNKEGTG